jgi:hypothetical protein
MWCNGESIKMEGRSAIVRGAASEHRVDAGGGRVGVQRLGEGVMAWHHVLLAAFLVQPDQPP